MTPSSKGRETAEPARPSSDLSLLFLLLPFVFRDVITKKADTPHAHPSAGFPYELSSTYDTAEYSIPQAPATKRTMCARRLAAKRLDGTYSPFVPGDPLSGLPVQVQQCPGFACPRHRDRPPVRLKRAFVCWATCQPRSDARLFCRKTASILATRERVSTSSLVHSRLPVHSSNPTNPWKPFSLTNRAPRVERMPCASKNACFWRKRVDVSAVKDRTIPVKLFQNDPTLHRRDAAGDPSPARFRCCTIHRYYRNTARQEYFQRYRRGSRQNRFPIISRISPSACSKSRESNKIWNT